MPLLRKQPFHRQKIPHDIHPEEEVFHCKITNEIFRDYNVFFERIILCNSLVWSCAITGKSGMTFKEAEECEEKAKKNLANFQDSLKKPLLYLATLTHRSRLNDVNDDVFMFAKDRFFIGETLEYTSDNQRKSCKVVSVIPQQTQEEKPNGDIIVIDDSDDSNQGISNEMKKKASIPDAAKYKYKIRITGQTDPIVVPATVLSRKRGLYSRDRSKLFLKQHCDPVDGLWKVKESTLRKLGLTNAVFEDYFPGPRPVFEVSQIKRKKNAKRPMEIPSSYIEFEEPPPQVPNKMMKNKSPKEPQIEYVHPPSAEDRALMKEKMKQQKLEEKEAKREEMRQRIEEEKLRRKEERDKERQKKIEEKRRELELQREWARPRDDLECDDLKEMPEFLPVRTRIPAELFGDVVMVMEFTHVFKSIFDFRQFFPKGFTWGMIESALMDHEPDGPLCDLMQMLLCALFNLQEEEAEEYQELEKEEKNVSKNEDKDDDVDDEFTKNEMIKSATIMAQFSQTTLGMPLRDTLLDQFTLSEILRIHILSSGAKASNKNARFRYQERGGYSEHDDPGLHMKIDFPSVVKSLAEVNVFDLPPEDKMKIIDTLIQQIMTYAMVRDMIEESSEKLRLKRYDLRQFQWAEQRREKEEQAMKYKKMMLERAKEQARIMQQLNAEQNGLPVEVPVPIEDKELEKQKEHEMETRKKAEFTKKETEMVEEILSLQKMVSIYPIGRDRLFRRYFFFPSLKGVFIEDHEMHVPADMLKPGLESADKGEKLKLLPQLTFHGKNKEGGDDCIVISDDESGNGKSDSQGIKKDNDTNDVNKTETQNGHENKDTNDVDKPEIKSADEMSVKVEKEAKPGDSKDTSPGEESPPVLENEVQDVEKSDQNPTWSFIDTPEYLNALLACLNNRGFRENALKVALTELKPFLTKSFQDCPSDILSLPEDGGEEKARIQALALTRGISSKKAAQDALMCVQEKAEATMEINLRDALLDMEDRIHVGGLGSLKIPDRAGWRAAILDRSYESQIGDPNFNSSNKTQMNGDDNSCDMTDNDLVARDLGRALVQIARGVEFRFLKDPLREDENKKKKGSKDKKKKDDGDDSDGESSAPKKQSTIYDRWEESLLMCTSLSQVYLHLASLDKSIVWAKSTLETRCRLCRRKGGAEKMLLCDGCDRGHHMYCLKPPMEKVPKGEWFCPDCRPKQVPRSPMRKGRRKAFVEEEPEPLEEEEMSADETMEEEEAEEDTTMEDEEEEEEEEEEDISEDENSDEEIEELEKNDYGEEVCTGCKTSGTLICCDCCPRAYHMHCAKPVLKKVPKGKWMCQVCMGIAGRGKIKIGGPNKASKGGKQKGKFTEVVPQAKGKDKKGTPANFRSNSRPNSRHGSPRDSPVLGKSRKHQLSSLATDDGQPKMKKSKSTSRISDSNANGSGSPIIRLMKPINPSSKRSNSHQQQLKAAEELINELMKQEDAWPFLKPVDKKLVPDYYNVIKHPMDFGTIRNKIHAFSYSKPSEMLADVRRIFSNCVEYNNRSSPEYKAYHNLSKYFDKRVKEKCLEEDVSSVKSNHSRLSL